MAMAWGVRLGQLPGGYSDAGAGAALKLGDMRPAVSC
jgi:hypothetical protein